MHSLHPRLVTHSVSLPSSSSAFLSSLSSSLSSSSSSISLTFLPPSIIGSSFNPHKSTFTVYNRDALKTYAIIRPHKVLVQNKSLASLSSSFFPPFTPTKVTSHHLAPLSTNDFIVKCKDASFEQTNHIHHEKKNQTKNRFNCFLIWGPPGAGKSTLAGEISTKYGMVHISSGDLLRAHLQYETEYGKKLLKVIEKYDQTGAVTGNIPPSDEKASATPSIPSPPNTSKLTPLSPSPYAVANMEMWIPDDIIIPIIIERISMADCQEHGVVLDGFPNSIAQNDAIKNINANILGTFILHCPRKALEDRIRYRRIDPETDKIYNVKCNPPESVDIQDRLIRFEADTADSVPRMLAEFGRMSSGVFDHLVSNPNVLSLDVDRPVSEILSAASIHVEQAGVAPKTYPFIRNEEIHHFIVPPSDLEKVKNLPERKRKGYNTTKEEEKPSSKAEISLVRCDGYMCERESVFQSNITFSGAATEQVMLVWNTPPKNVLLLAKKHAPELMPQIMEAVKYLSEEKNMKVYVEQFVQTEVITQGLFLDSFTDIEDISNSIDLVVCLGGDGLILHLNSLFKEAVPPVISFNLGSLGFLTPFDFQQFREEMEATIRGNIRLSLRMRLSCTVFNNATSSKPKHFQVLNEVVVDRGASPFLTNLNCFCDEKYITSVQADGIIMSTPTGSTAYSMSAGGSMVHPSIPAILFTPICPHSLSFRPLVFPDSATIQVEVAPESRSHAWVSFDGKSRQQLKRGDNLIVQMSLHPVPTINKMDHTGDWFGSLDRAFQFNRRASQKPLSPQKPHPSS